PPQFTRARPTAEAIAAGTSTMTPTLYRAATVVRPTCRAALSRSGGNTLAVLAMLRTQYPDPSRLPHRAGAQSPPPGMRRASLGLIPLGVTMASNREARWQDYPGSDAQAQQWIRCSR